MPIETTEERFWKYVDKTDDCWLWTGAKNNYGYGQLRIMGASIYAHRYSYEIHTDPIPPNLCVLHHCDVRNCVNPSHLFLGTKSDNAVDRENKGRGTDNRGEKNKKAKLTESSVWEIFKDSQRGLSQKENADKHKVSPQTVFDILNRKTWKHIPLK